MQITIKGYKNSNDNFKFLTNHKKQVVISYLLGDEKPMRSELIVIFHVFVFRTSLYFMVLYKPQGNIELFEIE